ncbi:hypothetical protein C4K88_03965 [Arthrobacter pityocampae]|uniref:ANTAR domain-containing protein n=1 Tax=Arthrobacter pityocampae TaxID=547334 RepID=A0A2S5IZ26_9MICC|nr:GAF and ANTAR domain-containing protein [Arthrobacter pityocampae]PPB49856.1 hypothetical protein C4K88_03965 [Arthrobacter pityocampae]
MSSTPRIDELGVIFGRTHGFLLSDATAQAAVDALAEIARDVIAHADGAGVSLIRDGRRISVGSTDARVLKADNQQYLLGEGPCLSAWATTTAIVVDDATTDRRWTRWASIAADAGVRSCLSVPLTRGAETLGAMKVYSRSPRSFGILDLRLLTNLATSAGALLGHVQAADTPQRISAAVEASLDGRDTISIARGILMERHGLDREAALERLVSLSHAAQTSISDTAATIEGRSPDDNATAAS